VNLSAAAPQTGEALSGVDEFEEGRFVRSQRLTDRCGREPARQLGPAVIVGHPSPLGGVAYAVAGSEEETSELQSLVWNS
jgi:hypothetical protein